MATKDYAFDDSVPSPCHLQFGCPQMAEDKEICSYECKKLEAFQKYIDACLESGEGQADYTDPYLFKLPTEVDDFADRNNFIEPSAWR